MNRMSVKLGQENFDGLVLKSEKLVLVDFYSDGCVPCKRLSPILTELEGVYKDKIFVGKVNAVFETELVEIYGITSTPTVLLFQNGEVRETLTGKIEKNDLIQVIENYG